MCSVHISFFSLTFSLTQRCPGPENIVAHYLKYKKCIKDNVTAIIYPLLREL